MFLKIWVVSIYDHVFQDQHDRRKKNQSQTTQHQNYASSRSVWGKIAEAYCRWAGL